MTFLERAKIIIEFKDKELGPEGWRQDTDEIAKLMVEFLYIYL